MTKILKIFIFKIFIFAAVVFISSSVFAAHKRLEKEYQSEWCLQHKGEIEVRLTDGTRCDCLASIDGVEYAIEFDFGAKWAEAIGQSLYYAVQTERVPGIVLILEDKKEYKYFLRLNTTLKYHNLEYVKTWIIQNYDTETSAAPSQMPAPTPTPATRNPNPSQYSCSPKKTCGKMTSCEEAYYHLNTCGNKSLDRDKDGVPCESICPGGK